MAAWYAPQSDYSLAARFIKPPAELAVTTSLLLVASDQGLEIMGGLSLLPQVERRFSFDLHVPAGWQVMSVTDPAGKALPFDTWGESSVSEKRPATPATKGRGIVFGEGNGNVALPTFQRGITVAIPIDIRDIAPQAPPAPGRIRVSVPGGIAVGQEFQINFRAVCTPPGWLADWKSLAVAFPRFAVLGAAGSQTAIAVDARDDLSVRPEKVAQLTPLGAAEKPKYGLANVNTTLAYRCEGPDYAAGLVVERMSPRQTARTFSFFRVDRDALNCHYELIYTVEEARTARLAFRLPAGTPESLSIVALDGVKLKEFAPELRDGRRQWNVLLAQRRRGRVRLAVDFQQPVGQASSLPDTAAAASTSRQDARSTALPVVVADGVAYQSGLVAVEGCAELDVQVKTAARPVDVGELAEADYQPGRRLLGAYSFTGNPPPVQIDVLRHPGYGLYATLVQQCELDTNVSPQGWSQTQAVFKLRTKAVFLQVRLPAGAELWSAALDGVPLKPQREGKDQGKSVLIDVPAAKADAVQTLQIVYAAPTDAVAVRGTMRLAAPKLFLRAEGSTAIPGREQGGTATAGREQPAQPGMTVLQPVEVPLADLVWRLHLPGGYEVVNASGTLTTDQLKPPPPAALQVAGVLYWLGGGVSNGPFWLPALKSARGPARMHPPAVEYYGQASTESLDEGGGDGRAVSAAGTRRMSSPSRPKIAGG